MPKHHAKPKGSQRLRCMHSLLPKPANKAASVSMALHVSSLMADFVRWHPLS